jgi:hypothetical protein
MWKWLTPWKSHPTPEPSAAEEVARRAPSTEGIRSGSAAQPRYCFTPFDNAPPRRTASQPGQQAPLADGPGPILGIDLGTTHAAVAVVQGRSIILIPNQEGQPRTPCVVGRTEDGDWLVGERARRQAVLAPDSVTRSFKRLLGRVDAIRLGEERYPPQQLAALVLRKLRQAAEAYLGQRVTRAVITVPASFDDGQIQAVLDAASIAGLETQWELSDPATGKSPGPP